MSSNPIEVPEERNDTAVAAAPPPPDPVAIAHLWASQFQHLTTLSVAGAGGVLILLQAQIIPLEQKWWVALTLFVTTAVVAIYGQIAVVDRASAGQPLMRLPRLLRGLAMMCLGAAGGAVIAALGLLD